MFSQIVRKCKLNVVSSISLGFVLVLIVASCTGASPDTAAPDSTVADVSTTAIPETTMTTVTTIPIVRAPLTGAAAPDETILERLQWS